MERLTTALVIVLVTTASAKPISWRQHYDADITDNDSNQGWLERNNWWSWWSSENSSNDDFSSDSDQSLESWESSESSESQSSEESSEEVLITDQTTPVMTTNAMTTLTTGDASMVTPDTMSTDEPNVTVRPPPANTTPPPAVTSPGNVTHCVTEEIPTEDPFTETRGDN